MLGAIQQASVHVARDAASLAWRWAQGSASTGRAASLGVFPAEFIAQRHNNRIVHKTVAEQQPATAITNGLPQTRNAVKGPKHKLFTSLLKKVKLQGDIRSKFSSILRPLQKKRFTERPGFVPRNFASPLASRAYNPFGTQRFFTTQTNTPVTPPTPPTQPPKPTPPPEKYSAVLARRLRAFGQRLRKNIGLQRPYTSDKILPLFNMMFIAMAGGVLLATTSVVSSVVWIVNRNDRWQEMFASYVSKTLTAQTGIDIKFQKVKGSWKDGTLKVEKVQIIRDPKTFPEGQDRNVAAIQLSIDVVAVEVSLRWFLQGNGWVREFKASGIKGVLDQTALDWSSNAKPPPRRPWRRGDFEFETLFLTDAEISLYQPYPDREVVLQLHVLDCDRVRQHRLLNDLLGAKSVYGTIDGSLFSLTRAYVDDERIKNKLKVGGLKVDLVSGAAEGPVSWLTEGTIDVECELDFKPENVVPTDIANYTPDLLLEKQSIPSPDEQPDGLLFDTKLKFNNLRASVPPNPQDMAWFHQVLVRPVVAYMNTNYTSIPLHFKVLLPNSQLEGATTPWEAGLWDALSVGVSSSFLVLIKQQTQPENIRSNLAHVARSALRGWTFMVDQLQGYYWLWYFNDEDEGSDVPPASEFTAIPNGSDV